MKVDDGNMNDDEEKTEQKQKEQQQQQQQPQQKQQMKNESSNDEPNHPPKSQYQHLENPNNDDENDVECPYQLIVHHEGIAPDLQRQLQPQQQQQNSTIAAVENDGTVTSSCSCGVQEDFIKTTPLHNYNNNNDYEQPLPQRNLSLPDVDDLSMNKVFTYIEFYHLDLFWSFLSDSCFILGGIAYVILSLFDYYYPNQEHDVWYDVLELFAPAVYVLNSIIDTKWSIHVHQRNKVKRSMQEVWTEWRSALLQPEVEDQLSLFPELLLTSTSSCCHEKFRKHMAHRRSIIAALLFGIAAMLTLIAAFLETDRDGLEIASSHIYALSAIIAITGKRVRPWLQPEIVSTHLGSWDCPGVLEDAGDLLFFVGCVIEAVLDDFDLDAPILYIFSSVFWLTDACFYMRSDIIRASQLHRNREEAKYLV